MPYDFQAIESKWQRKWTETRCFEAKPDPSKEKFFCLEMFPYPSGALHMGQAGDHRIVMLAAIAASVCEDCVIIKDAKTVNKSSINALSPERRVLPFSFISFI